MDSRDAKNKAKETLEDKLDELIVVKALEKLLGSKRALPTVFPIRPKIQTNAGETIRELRGRSKYY